MKKNPNSNFKYFNLRELKKFIAVNFWVGGTTFFKALSQLVTLKVLALYLGVEAIGVFGQATSCVVALNSIFSMGLLNFSVTEFSRTSDKPNEQKQIWGAIGLWIIISQVLFIIVAFLFAGDLSKFIFSNPEFKWFFYVLAALSVFFNLHSVSMGFLSAVGDVKKIFMSHLFSFISSSAALYFLVVSFINLTPLVATLTVLISQSIWLVFFVFQTKRVRISSLAPVYHKDHFLKILKFTLVLIVTSLLAMFYQIYMRTAILNLPNHSWVEVGQWQAVLKISEITMSFLGLSIMTSYFPQMSRLTTIEEIRDYVWKFSHRYIGLVILSLSTLIIFSGLILRIIYDKSFEGLSDLLRLQLLGDAFKLLGWLFTYFFLAKLSLFIFLSFEVLSLASLTVLSLFFKDSYGFEGLVYAHCVNSFLFFTFGFFAFKIILKKGNNLI